MEIKNAAVATPNGRNQKKKIMALHFHWELVNCGWAGDCDRCRLSLSTI